MDRFSVNQLAQLAGVSVRTLHHYDSIGLLKPSLRGENNYRYYSRNELLRLQQILLYKTLDVPLQQIALILDDPGFDMLAALQEHKHHMLKRKKNLEELLLTIDNTIVKLKQQTEKMNYEDLYKGFSKEEAEAYRKEAVEKWGNQVTQSEQRLMKMTKAEFEELQQEATRINDELAALMPADVTGKQVQELVKRHHRMIGHYYEVIPEIYRGLAQMYVADERFTRYYENVKTGLAQYLSNAMLHFCTTL